MSKEKDVEKLQMEFVREELKQRDYTEEKYLEDKLNGLSKITSEYSEIELDGIGKVRVYSPNFTIEAEIQKFRVAQRFKLMKDFPEIPTKKQMLSLLKERGEWGEVQENELTEINAELEELELEFKDISSPSKNKSEKEENKLLKKIVELRLRRHAIIEEFEEHMANTLEGLVENLCKFYSLFKCIKTEDGSYVWKSFEEMMNNIDESKIGEIFKKVAEYWQSLRNDFLEVRQEAKTGE